VPTPESIGSAAVSPCGKPLPVPTVTPDGSNPTTEPIG
jgi:hypothetical protein